MTKHLYQIVLLISIIHYTCKGPSQKDPILVEAFEIHKEAVDIAANALKVCDELPAGDVRRTKFRATLEDWGDNLIEVPGFHYHHDGLGHHHNRPPIKLTPDEALKVQKEFRDSIVAIHGRLLLYQSDQLK